jgi:hypothetical protein
MSKSKQVKNKRDIREFPLDWDIHINKTFNFYFDIDYPICFLGGTLMLEGYSSPEKINYESFLEIDNIQDIKILLISGEESYHCLVYYSTELMCTIFKNVELTIDLDTKTSNYDFSYLSTPYTIMLMQPIDFISANTPYDLAQEVERVIIEDQREDDEDDGNDDNDDDFDFNPDSPIGKLLYDNI